MHGLLGHLISGCWVARLLGHCRWLLGRLVRFDELADGLTAWLVDLVECFARLRDWSTNELLGCLVIVG